MALKWFSDCFCLSSQWDQQSWSVAIHYCLCASKLVHLCEYAVTFSWQGHLLLLIADIILTFQLHLKRRIIEPKCSRLHFQLSSIFIYSSFGACDMYRTFRLPIFHRVQCCWPHPVSSTPKCVMASKSIFIPASSQVPCIWWWYDQLLAWHLHVWCGFMTCLAKIFCHCYKL